MTKLFLGEVIQIWVCVTWMENFPNGTFWWLGSTFSSIYIFWGKKLNIFFYIILLFHLKLVLILRYFSPGWRSYLCSGKRKA